MTLLLVALVSVAGLNLYLWRRIERLEFMLDTEVEINAHQAEEIRALKLKSHLPNMRDAINAWDSCWPGPLDARP